jgi:hypothetical protein
MQLTGFDGAEGPHAATGAHDAHLSGEAFELLLVSALAPPEANAAKRHLDDCEACRARWRAVHDDAQLLVQELTRRSPGPTATPLASARPAQHTRLRLWSALVAGASAVAFAYAGGLSHGAFGTAVPAPGVEVRRSAAGQLSASVRSDGARYLLLFARQPRGPFTLAWPLDAEVSGPLARRGRATPDLPDGVAEVVGVFSDAPVSRALAERALQADPVGATVPGAWLVRVQVGGRR